MLCKACGGEANLIGHNRYRCPYCTFEFVEADIVVEQPIPVAAPPRPQPQPQPQPQQPPRRREQGRGNQGVSVFEDNVNGVLEITWNLDAMTATSGSGLLLDEEGHCLTNTHVVAYDNGKPCSEMNVKIAGKKTKAKVIRMGDDKAGSGKGVDLALIKLTSVPVGAKPLTLANFDDVKIGEQVFVIGNSLGDGTCITSGIVSDKTRKVSGQTVLMTDCAINGGNSGGPIFNSLGEVIGVIVSSRIHADGSATEGMNYAIPINIAEEFINGKLTLVNVNRDSSSVTYTSASSKNPVCPFCKGKNTEVDAATNVAYCYDCQKEF